MKLSEQATQCFLPNSRLFKWFFVAELVEAKFPCVSKEVRNIVFSGSVLWEREWQKQGGSNQGGITVEKNPLLPS
jgi:hypothetical protein